MNNKNNQQEDEHQIERVPVIWRKLSDLTPNSDNPRVIKKAELDRLKLSMLRNPTMINGKPILLSDRTGKLVIIGGNQRYTIAKQMGYDELPTVLFSGLTEEREKEIIVRDNVSDGEWDWEQIANGWADLDVIKLWGVDAKADPKVKGRDVMKKLTLKLTEEEYHNFMRQLEDLMPVMETGSIEETLIKIVDELCRDIQN